MDRVHVHWNDEKGDFDVSTTKMSIDTDAILLNTE